MLRRTIFVLLTVLRWQAEYYNEMFNSYANGTNNRVMNVSGPWPHTAIGNWLTNGCEESDSFKVTTVPNATL